MRGLLICCFFMLYCAGALEACPELEECLGKNGIFCCFYDVCLVLVVFLWLCVCVCVCVFVVIVFCYLLFLLVCLFSFCLLFSSRHAGAGSLRVRAGSSSTVAHAKSCRHTLRRGGGTGCCPVAARASRTPRSRRPLRSRRCTQNRCVRGERRKEKCSRF